MTRKDYMEMLGLKYSFEDLVKGSKKLRMNPNRMSCFGQHSVWCKGRCSLYRDCHKCKHHELDCVVVVKEVTQWT